MLLLPIGGGDVDLSDLRLDICITKNTHHGKVLEIISWYTKSYLSWLGDLLF